MSFQDDIKGQNTQLFPIVKIGGNYYSTNNVTVDGNYCKPILMNIPSIKESIDIESRKFKISNVSLEFNNFPFDGVRFSNQLASTSLINTESIIYFKSPSGLKEVYKGIIRRISHDDTKVSVGLEDLTEQKAHKSLPQALDQNGVVGVLGDGDGVPDKHKNKPIPMVYGHVDRSPCLLTGTYDEEYDFFQISKIIIDSKDIHSKEETTISIANKTIIETPVYLLDGVHTFNCASEGNVTNDGTNFIDYNNTEPYIELNIDKEIDNSSNLGLARLRKLREPIKAIARYYGQGGDGNQSNRFAPAGGNDGSIFPPLPPTSEHIYDNNNNTYWILLGYGKDIEGDYWDDIGEGEYNAYIYFAGAAGIPLPNGDTLDNVAESAFVTLSFAQLDGDFDLKSKVFINYEIINQSNSFNLALDMWLGEIVPSYESNYLNAFDDTGKEIGLLNAAQRAIIARMSPNDTVVNEDYSENDFSGGFDITSILDSFSIPMGVLNFGIPFHRDTNLLAHSGAAIKDFKVKDLVLYQTGQSDDLNKYDLYANVKGRVSTFQGHHYLSFYNYGDPSDEYNEAPSYIQALASRYPDELNPQGDEEFLEYLYEIGYIMAIDAGTLIENPIDIIYDLVISELGFPQDAINYTEYIEAKAAHKLPDGSNWKFGFSQTKKISAKELIQEIAKSTKCFPKFKNDGTFGFNTIKDTYTVSDIDEDGAEKGDYNNAHLIKESEVISYSFKKTKPEQIYQKVNVQYKKDYAQDSYLKRSGSNIVVIPEDISVQVGSDNLWTTTLILGNPAYYGIGLAVNGASDASLEFESDYIRHKETADELAKFLIEQYKNDHLLFNLKLPLQYINLEIGDLVKFDGLFNKLKAYGIDYTLLDNINSQQRFPLFMVTASTKNLDSVSIECMQLHALVPVDESEWALLIPEAPGGEEQEEELIIEDTTAPVITISSTPLEYYVGDDLIPFTATAVDDTDGDLPVVITYTGSEWYIALIAGSYNSAAVFDVIYTAVDAAGNVATHTDEVTVSVPIVEEEEGDFFNDVATTLYALTNNSMEAPHMYIYRWVSANWGTSYWLINLNAEIVDLTEHMDIFTSNFSSSTDIVLQIKSSVASILVRQNSQLYSSPSEAMGGHQRIRLEYANPNTGLFDSVFPLDALDGFAVFSNVDDNGDTLGWRSYYPFTPSLSPGGLIPFEITRMTEVSTVLGSPVFDDKVRDFTVIKDIDKW